MFLEMMQASPVLADSSSHAEFVANCSDFAPPRPRDAEGDENAPVAYAVTAALAEPFGRALVPAARTAAAATVAVIVIASAAEHCTAHLAHTAQ